MTKRKVYTVRQPGTGRTLYRDPLIGWRWSEDHHKTPMARDEAIVMAERLGGVVCVNGLPEGKVAPPRPKMPKGRAPGERDPVAEIRALMDAEDWAGAIKRAARMPRLGDDKKTIERAWEAYARPDFCRALGRDPDALKAAGIEAVRRRFGGD